MRIRVERRWRGAAGQEVEVRTGQGGGDCGYDFEGGKKYLVYARSDDGVLRTTNCDRTRPLAEAAEDLEYFKTAFNPSKGGTIFGTARDDAGKPVSGYPVALSGSGRRWRTKLDANGRYAFTNIPVGTYFVDLGVPATRHAYGTSQVELADSRGCAVASFSVVPLGRNQ